MFTGLIEEVGTLRDVQVDGHGVTFTIACERVLEGTRIGDSIAVNGTCLTVTRLDSDAFAVGLSPETRRRTALDAVGIGTRVNLERALPVAGRLDGHIVQGHVDTTGTVVSWCHDADALWLEVELETDWMRYVVPKGYIAIDGTSLTVVDAGERRFTVTLVAHTQAHVALTDRETGDRVNIEVDVLGKYVERLLAFRLADPDDTSPPSDDDIERVRRAARALAGQTIDRSSDA